MFKTWVIVTLVKENDLDKQTHKLLDFINIYCHSDSEGFISANYKGVISDNSPIIALMKITKSDLLIGFIGMES